MFQSLRRSLSSTLFCLALPALGMAKPPYWVYAYILQNQDTNGKEPELGHGHPLGGHHPHRRLLRRAHDQRHGGHERRQGHALITAAHNTGTRCYLSLGGGGQSGALRPTSAAPT